MIKPVHRLSGRVMLTEGQGKPWPRPVADNDILVAVKEVLHRSEDRQKTIGSWERESRILQKMNELRQEHIVRFLTAFRRGDEDSKDYYLMFEWANGINLRCLWKTEEIRTHLTADLTKAALKQILGLARALCRAHCPETRPDDLPRDLNFRHGDLKPENILWFRDNTQLGTLKIADWGLAKQNNLVTPLRTNNTSTGAGTARYKPPEEELDILAAKQVGGLLHVGNMAGIQPRRRSRLYDVWAMGCITLEFLIWLLYGYDGQQRFNHSFKTAMDNYPPFYQVETVNGKPVARVHDIAVKWMDYMAKDPACAPGKTALGNLLELIRTGLLVVKLPVVNGTSWDTSAPQTLSTVRQGRQHAVPSLLPIVVSRPATNSATHQNMGAMPDIIVSTAAHDDENQQQGPASASRPAPAPRPAPRPAPVTGPSFSSGPFRALTPMFLKRMEDIYSDLNDASYWFTDVPNRSLPPGTDDLPYTHSRNNSNSYHTQGSVNSVPTGTIQSKLPSTRGVGPVRSSAQPGALAVPTQQRVCRTFIYSLADLGLVWALGLY